MRVLCIYRIVIFECKYKKIQYDILLDDTSRLEKYIAREENTFNSYFG